MLIMIDGSHGAGMDGASAAHTIRQNFNPDGGVPMKPGRTLYCHMAGSKGRPGTSGLVSSFPLSLLRSMIPAPGAQACAAPGLLALATFDVRSATFRAGAPEAQAFMTTPMLRTPECQALSLRSMVKQLPLMLI